MRILIVALTLVLVSCSGDAPPPNYPAEQAAYTIFIDEDYSFPGRNRWRVGITSDATDKLIRAATAMHAAYVYQLATDADQVQVFIESDPDLYGKGEALANITYTPDGCGNDGQHCTGKRWDVMASKQSFSTEDIAIAKAWYQHREQFLDNNVLNERSLKQFLIDKLKLNKSVDDRFLRFVSMEAIDIE